MIAGGYEWVQDRVFVRGRRSRPYFVFLAGLALITVGYIVMLAPLIVVGCVISFLVMLIGFFRQL